MLQHSNIVNQGLWGNRSWSNREHEDTAPVKVCVGCKQIGREKKNVKEEKP